MSKISAGMLNYNNKIMASFNSEHSASTQPDEDKAQEEDPEPPPSPRKELARQQKERRAADADAYAVKKQEAALNRGFGRIKEFFGKDPRPGQRAVLKALCESKDVVLRARTGFGKSLIFYGFLLMQPVDSKRDVTIIFNYVAKSQCYKTETFDRVEINRTKNKY